jgi:hypothetical protein
MPEDKSHDRPPADPEPKVADAGLLFQDASKPTPPKVPPQAEPNAPPESGEEFALADAPEWASDWAPAQFPSPPRARPPAPATGEPRSDARPEAPREVTRNPSDQVEQTWSRWAEWGPNLIAVGAWAAVLLLLVYFVFGQEFYGLALVLLLVGSVVAVVLSYPMLITLERPVRVTPEQALRDYYGALSHHVPHLRRMWLLLSTAGRVSTAFGSFEGFKGYWREELGRLREGHAGPLTPLVFEIVNFKSEKSAGKSRIDASYTVNVSVRGRRSAGPIHAIPASISLVRGPDNMWYLENGTLPRGQAGTKSGARL